MLPKSKQTTIVNDYFKYYLKVSVFDAHNTKQLPREAFVNALLCIQLINISEVLPNALKDTLSNAKQKKDISIISVN